MKKGQQRKVVAKVKKAVKVLQDANKLGKAVRPARLLSKGLDIAAGLAQNDLRRQRLQRASDAFGKISNISGYGLIKPEKRAARQEKRAVRQEKRAVRRAARIAGRPARIAAAKDFGRKLVKGIVAAHQFGQKYKPISTASNIAGVLAPAANVIPGLGGAISSGLELGAHGGKLIGDITGYGMPQKRMLRKPKKPSQMVMGAGGMPGYYHSWAAKPPSGMYRPGIVAF
jgi:hypothetical protein